MKKILLALITLTVLALTIGIVSQIYRFQIYKPVEHEVPQIFPEPLASILTGVPKSISIESPAFKNNSVIPTKYTCDGDNVSPELRITNNIPSNTKSLVILVFDPDAPMGTFWHWIFYGIKPSQSITIPEGILKTDYTEYGINGLNDFGSIGYGGPCPPRGDKPHRYVFVVLALDIESSWDPRLRLSDIVDRIKGHVVAYGYTIGLYSR